MISKALYWAVAVVLATLLVVTAARGAELPVNSDEIRQLWVEGKAMEPGTRHKLRTHLTPTPQDSGGMFVGLNIDPCKAPDGYTYGINWPVFTEQERDMWKHVLAATSITKAKQLFTAMLHGTEMLYDMAGFTDYEKEVNLKRLKVMERDCFPKDQEV